MSNPVAEAFKNVGVDVEDPRSVAGFDALVWLKSVVAQDETWNQENTVETPAQSFQIFPDVQFSDKKDDTNV